MPYEDLESIAGLRLGQLVEQVTQERSTGQSAALNDLARRGLSGGPVACARLNLAMESAEKTCRGLYEIWRELILQRNKGRITRDEVNFIMQKVDSCAQAQAGGFEHALSAPGGLPPESAMQMAREAKTKAESIAARIRRELEIKLQEQEAFPEQKPDLRFVAFLRAFGESWLTMMSGPLTVPFAIVALFVSGFARLVFAVLALAAGVFSSYHVWRRAKLDKKPAKT